MMSELTLIDTKIDTNLLVYAFYKEKKSKNSLFMQMQTAALSLTNCPIRSRG